MESSRMEKKRKDKDGTNNKPPKNNKKRKLEPLIDWGENKIGTEQGIIPREWFLTSLEEENETAEIDLDLNIEVDWRSKPRIETGRKMKQLEIDFSKAIVRKNKEEEKLETEDETSSETEDEQSLPDGWKQEEESGTNGWKDKPISITVTSCNVSNRVGLSGVAGGSSKLACTIPIGGDGVRQCENPHVKTLASKDENVDLLTGNADVKSDEDEAVPDGRNYTQDCYGGRAGVHTPTGSSSNIVLLKEDSKDITKDTIEEEYECKDKRKAVKPLKTKPYKRNTGKIKKKEEITLAKKNMKITSWIKDKTWSVRKERRETEYRRLEDETILDMEWSDPTEEQRKTEKVKKAQRKKDHLLNTLMIREMMTKMAGEIPALASVMEVVDSMVEEAVETGEVEMIWRRMIKDEKVLKKLERKIEEGKSSQRLEEGEKLKQRRLEAQKVMKEKWLRRMEINQLIDEVGGLDLS